MLNKIKDFIIKYSLLLIIIFFICFICFFFNENKQKFGANEVKSVNGIFMSDSAPTSHRVMKLASLNNSFAISSVSDEKKIVNNYSLTIEVNDTDNIRSQIEEEIKKSNINIENFNSYIYSNDKFAYDWILRVPVNNIDRVFKVFRNFGKIKNENSSSINYTETYIDNENRLKNLYARRDRLRDMMKTKTSKLSDVLSVDKELSNVQIEIENLERNNKKIDNDVEYSKLNLSLIPEIQIETFNNVKWTFEKSWKKSVNKLILFTHKLVDFIFIIISFIPYLLCIILIYKFFQKKSD